MVIFICNLKMTIIISGSHGIPLLSDADSCSSRVETSANHCKNLKTFKIHLYSSSDVVYKKCVSRWDVGNLLMIVPYHSFCYSCSEMQKLDQDHSRLERTCEVAEKMGASLQEAHARFHSMLKKTAEQQKKYESEVVVLRGWFLETRHSLSYMKA